MITLENEFLCARIALRGGELQSLRSRQGIEYIWQADPEFWPMHSPGLFPIVGRSGTQGTLLEGSVYQMPMHGFLMGSELEPEWVGQTECMLTLHSSKVTHVWYPYDFVFRMHYILQGDRLALRSSVKNTGERRLYYGLGGHPGFRVPLGEDSRFEDCFLSFQTPGDITRVEMTPAGYVSGVRTKAMLDNGNIKLRHSLFDRDAVVLENTGGQITLTDPAAGHGIRMEYSDFPYLGLWHNPGRKAPFVCLEPWSTLPSRKIPVEDLREKPDIRTLAPGEEETLGWTIQVF